MKNNNKIIILLVFLSLGFLKAQDLKNWRSIEPKQRKELIEKMTPEERLELLKEFRDNMLVDELDLPKEKQEEFKSLYNEYQESQRQIKGQFRANTNYEKMSDEEAKKELEQSFFLGQQLLDNRRKYASKFQRMMKPQQVLEMFQNEGMMRNKMMERKREDRERGGMQNNDREAQDRGRQLQENANGSHRDNATRNSNGTRSQSRRP